MSGTELAIGAAVIIGGGLMAFIAWKELEPTFGGSETQEAEAWLGEKCEDLIVAKWHVRSDKVVNEQVAVDQFMRDTDPSKSWDDGALVKRYFTKSGSLIGNALGGLFGGLFRGESDNNGGDAGGEKPQLTSDEKLAIEQLRTQILAKLAKCQAEEAAWYNEVNTDFQNMLDYMAVQICQNASTVCTHAMADSFFAKKQSTLPPEMAAYTMTTVYSYVDAVNAAYKPVTGLNLSAADMTAVLGIVRNYMNTWFYNLLMWKDSGIGYFDSAATTDNTMSKEATCTQILVACNKAGLGPDAKAIALAPCYYLSRVVGFRPDVGVIKPWVEALKSPTLADGLAQANAEIQFACYHSLQRYYQANPTAGPLWTQDNCRYWFIQIGMDKAGVNAGGSAVWAMLKVHVPSLPPYQAV
jgi:hypothetical protein